MNIGTSFFKSMKRLFFNVLILLNSGRNLRSVCLFEVLDIGGNQEAIAGPKDHCTLVETLFNIP